MTRVLLVLLALAIMATVTLAQQLPPPRNPAGNEPEALLPGLVLVPPQNEKQPPQNAAQLLPQNGPQQPAPRVPVAAPAAKKNPGELKDLYAARLRLQNARKQAQIDRMNQFKAARAAEQQKLYRDWHERYLADTPVRVEYYRAMAAAYQSQPAVPYYTAPYYYGAGPPVILAPVYAPLVYTPVYGTLFYGGW